MKENPEITIATTHNVNWLDEHGTVLEHATWKLQEDGPTVFTTARSLAGNMSPAYNQYGQDMSPEEKKIAAEENLAHAFEANGIRKENGFIMLPQQNWSGELGVVYVDDEFTPGESDKPVVAKERADLLITKNPDVAMVCRPADCPVLTLYGTGIDGNETLGLLHVGWQGLNAGYLEQGMQKFIEAGVDKDSVRVQMSGAGYAESFHYKNTENPLDDASFAKNEDGTNAPKRFTHPEREHLFVNVVKTEQQDKNGQDVYEFDMDMPGFIRYQLKELGYSEYQLFEEGSDTTDAESGYSSHRRDGGDKTKNTRDAVISTLAKPDQRLIRQTHVRKHGGGAVRSVGIGV